MPAASHHDKPGLSRRSVLSLAGAAAIATPLALAGCGESSSGGTSPKALSTKPETLTFYWWGSDVRATITGKVLDLYTQKHPNVTFKQQWGAYSGYYDKLSTMVAGSTAPDIFQIDDDGLAEYASRHVTLDLKPYVGKTIKTDKFPSGLAKAGILDGKQAAVAAAENTAAMFYDKTVVSQYKLDAPKTGMSWDDLITWAAKVTQASGGKVYGTSDPSGAFQVLEMWLRQHGKEFYKDGKLWVTSSDMNDWFQFWSDARRKNATPTADITHAANTGDVTKSPLATKRGATAFQWSNQLEAAAKTTDHQLGIVAYPGDTGHQWARASMYWCVYSGSKHADRAADVIQFFLNDPDAAKLLGAERGLAPNLDVRKSIQSTLTANNQTSSTFETVLSKDFSATPPPPPRGHKEIRDFLTSTSESVLFGKASPKDAASQFITQAKGALSG
jgi:multiple sugar transport system substrate-binding protein